MEMIALSPTMQEFLKRAERIAPLPDPVLIVGEVGVGKEHLARWIHERSSVAKGPFLRFDCTGASADLLVEKFLVLNGGREGWIRERGTLFLHQLEELAPEAQKALGYYLEQDPDARNSHRIIASASPLIFQRRDRGSFQKALFYRLSVHLFEVPPLRMRPEDIPALVRHFLAQIDPQLRLEPALLEMFQQYSWPGNLLELRNLLQQMALNAEEPVLRTRDLPEWFLRYTEPRSSEDASLRERSF